MDNNFSFVKKNCTEAQDFAVSPKEWWKQVFLLSNKNIFPNLNPAHKIGKTDKILQNNKKGGNRVNAE